MTLKSFLQRLVTPVNEPDFGDPSFRSLAEKSTEKLREALRQEALAAKKATIEKLIAGAKLKEAEYAQDRLRGMFEAEAGRAAEGDVGVSRYNRTRLKIVTNGRIDLIPLADINSVVLTKGYAPFISTALFELFNMAGSYGREHRWSDEESVRDFTADVAIEPVDDVVKLTPTFSIKVPHGYGETVFEQIAIAIGED